MADSRCRYCGSSNFGGGCRYSPYKNNIHEHGPTGNYRKCVYCGSSSYGSGCVYSPTGKHVHFSDGEHCIYCGKSFSYARDSGGGCVYSPSRKHSL